MKIRTKKIIMVLTIFVLFMFAGSYMINKNGIHSSNFRLVKDELLNRENERVAGIYYQGNITVLDTTKKYAHLVLVLNNESNLNINMSILEKVPQNMDILLTMEFWGDKFIQKYDGSPLKEIIDGSLDAKLNNIYERLLNGKRTIYVRINPEMELWTYQFPWHNSDYYIGAYRHIVTKWKNQNPNLKFVWGPSGFMGAERFYPGDDVVDFVSITLQSQAEKGHDRYPSYKNSDQEMHRKLHRMRFIDKPFMIIVSANTYSNDQIITSAYAAHNIIDKHKEICYSNDLWNNSDTASRINKFEIGLYDPRQLLISNAAITVEHLFIDIGQIQLGKSGKEIEDVFSRGRNLILSFEPWKDMNGDSDPDILDNIVQGKYDSVIKQLYEEIKNSEKTIYLRFAHEMEIPITRYSWQSKDPVDYIKAYRYFMQFMEPFPKNVKRVWGPAGDRGSPDFYPGDDVVDYISFAAYGLPDKNITDFKKQRLFSSIYYDKRLNFKHINKPFFLTEFGVKGPDEYKMQWMEDAAYTLKRNPQVIGACYFNMSDTPGAWGDIKEPDWSITSDVLNRFLEVLNRKVELENDNYK